MAFTSRAERETLVKGLTSTPATVGPGSYGTYFNQVCIGLTFLSTCCKDRLALAATYPRAHERAIPIVALTHVWCGGARRRWGMPMRHFRAQQSVTWVVRFGLPILRHPVLGLMM